MQSLQQMQFISSNFKLQLANKHTKKQIYWSKLPIEPIIFPSLRIKGTAEESALWLKKFIYSQNNGMPNDQCSRLIRPFRLEFSTLQSLIIVPFSVLLLTVIGQFSLEVPPVLCATGKLQNRKVDSQRKLRIKTDCQQIIRYVGELDSNGSKLQDFELKLLVLEGAIQSPLQVYKNSTKPSSTRRTSYTRSILCIGEDMLSSQSIILCFQNEYSIMIKHQAKTSSEPFKSSMHASDQIMWILRYSAYQCASDNILQEHRDPRYVDKLLSMVVDKVQDINEMEFVHRDLKPENIGINLNLLQAWIIDFDRANSYLLKISFLGHMDTVQISSICVDGRTRSDVLVVSAIIKESHIWRQGCIERSAKRDGAIQKQSIISQPLKRVASWKTCEQDHYQDPPSRCPFPQKQLNYFLKIQILEIWGFGYYQFSVLTQFILVQCVQLQPVMSILRPTHDHENSRILSSQESVNSKQIIQPKMKS